jgi:CheY-like chemotaxis protein
VDESAKRVGKQRDMPLTVVVVDDDEGFRDLLKSSWGGSVAVLGEGASGEEAVRLAAGLRPDAVVIAIHVPGLDALEATRQIKAVSPETKVVLLTVHDEEAYLSSTGKSGADALLPKRKARTEALSLLRSMVGQPHPPWDGRDRRERGLGSPALWFGRERRRKANPARKVGGGSLGSGGRGTEVA